jgi:hypothetical protein
MFARKAILFILLMYTNFPMDAAEIAKDKQVIFEAKDNY